MSRLCFFRGSTWSIYLSSTLPGQVPEAERFIPGIEQRLEAFVVSIGTGFPQYVRGLLHQSHNNNGNRPYKHYSRGESR